MKTIKIPSGNKKTATSKPAREKGNDLKDLVPNVGFKDAVIRFGITVLILMALLLINKHLIIYAAPVMAYLFISAIGHFCIIKFIWHRYVKHGPAPALPPYGTDPNYPDESI